MSDARTFDDRLRAWLVDGPEAAPPDLIDLVLADVSAVRVGKRWSLGERPRWLDRESPARTILLAASVAVVVAIASLAIVPRRDAPVGIPNVSPSPTAHPSGIGSPTPVGSLPFQPCTPTTVIKPPGLEFDPATVRGLIAYRVDTRILAVDPANPAAPVEMTSYLRADPRSWSNDGTRLVLVGPSADGFDQAVVFDRDGGVTRVADWGEPAFSPDGNTIVYAVPGGGLCLVNADGSSPRLLAFDMSEPFNESPAWSPDGLTIAWLDFVEDHPIYGHHASGLSFIDPDGGNLRQLAVALPGKAGDGGLVWSPDGSRLAFWMTGPSESAPAQIFLIDADGTDLRQITRDGDNRWPSWSPDGSRIAFVRDGALVTSKPDGTDVVPVPGITPDGSIAWNPVQ